MRLGTGAVQRRGPPVAIERVRISLRRRIQAFERRAPLHPGRRVRRLQLDDPTPGRRRLTGTPRLTPAARDRAADGQSPRSVVDRNLPQGLLVEQRRRLEAAQGGERERTELQPRSVRVGLAPQLQQEGAWIVGHDLS